MQATSDPGKIATYCSAILQRVNYMLSGVQCLVIAFDFDYVDEIVTAMARFGDHLHVKVKSCTEINLRKSPPIDAHVIVGTQNTSLLDVKTIVFDGRQFNLMLALIKLCVYHMVFKHNRSCQFGVIF